RSFGLRRSTPSSPNSAIAVKPSNRSSPVAPARKPQAFVQLIRGHYTRLRLVLWPSSSRPRLGPAPTFKVALASCTRRVFSPSLIGGREEVGCRIRFQVCSRLSIPHVAIKG